MADLKKALVKGISAVDYGYRSNNILVCFHKGFDDDDMIVIETEGNIAKKVSYAHPFAKDVKEEHDVKITVEDVKLLLNKLTYFGFNLELA